MAKPTIDQQEAMPDLIGSVDFRLLFDRLPGVPGYDPSRLALNVTQAIIPGVTINKVEQRFGGGHKLNYAMSLTHSGTMAIQIVERVTMESLHTLKKWQEFVRGTRTGNASGFKAAYAATARLEVFDGVGNVAEVIRIFGCFPSELPETQLDSSSEAQAILYSASFSYDYWEPEGARNQ